MYKFRPEFEYELNGHTYAGPGGSERKLYCAMAGDLSSALFTRSDKRYSDIRPLGYSQLHFAIEARPPTNVV